MPGAPALRGGKAKQGLANQELFSQQTAQRRFPRAGRERVDCQRVGEDAVGCPPCLNPPFLAHTCRLGVVSDPWLQIPTHPPILHFPKRERDEAGNRRMVERRDGAC